MILPLNSKEASDMAVRKRKSALVTAAKPSATPMGPLELAVYRTDWKASRAYFRHLEDLAARRVIEAAAEKVAETSLEPRAGSAKVKGRPASATSRNIPDDDDDEEKTSGPARAAEAPTPGRIAARLLLARLFDRNPSVMVRLLSSTSVVVVDVPDRAMHSRIAHQWKEVLALQDMKIADFARLSDATRRDDYDAISAVFGNILVPADRGAADVRAFAAVQLALPIIAITPSAESHLSKVLLDASTDRLLLPPIDAALIAAVIRIVTGKPCRTVLPDGVASGVGLHELLLAVRFDRTPGECIDNLMRMVRAKTAKLGSRDLALDELHGLDEAVAWAKGTIMDVAAWRRGEIAWDAVDAGVVLNGPPGTGKTTFAKIFAAATGLPLVTATLAKWQGSGEAHLGHLLRAMRKDFDEARSKSPAIVFIDELDSFPNRSALTHSYKDYVIEVVNAFIEQLDGLQGRQGLIFVGATNDVRRCDPAIVRAGRLNRIIEVRLPAPGDIEKMMRVRLRGDLDDEPLLELSLLAIGSSGADVERIVKDARRAARQEQRPLTVKDLRDAILGRNEDLAPGEVERAAVHEAGHIIVSVVHDGPEDIHAVVAGSRQSAGFVAAKNRQPSAGTLEEFRHTLQGLLAGRAAEEIQLGAAGNGAGGSQGSDLALATRIAAALVGSFGHAGPHPLLFMADHYETNAIMGHADLRAAAHLELAAAFDEAKRILTTHRAALAEVAAWLRARGRIDGHEVQRIIDANLATGG
jgi:cell division protease FtsH